MTIELSDEELRALDTAVERAIDGGGTSHLEVLGYGEISAVVAWPTMEGVRACKRLPPFADEASVEAYSACVADYLDALRRAGVTPLETAVQWLALDEGGLAAFCVQPLHPSEALLHKRLQSCDRGEAEAHFERVLALFEACVSPRVGLDGQASNWVVTDEGLAYLDVSTPMLRDSAGHERLDTELFLASLPWALRGVVRRFLLGSILDKYYEVRGVVLDFLGNFHKEGLGHLIPPLMAIANQRVEPVLTEDEIRSYYRSDAIMWEVLQRLRHADRAWQRRIRRRRYPFLLPGRIERNV